MEKMVTSLRLPLAMNEEIEVLVESGEYPSRSDVLKEAFRVFLENKPEKKTLIGIELYPDIMSFIGYNIVYIQ